MDQGKEPGGAGRAVLEGAFALLEELARTGGAGLTSAAAGAGLPKATAHRLLQQLVTLGAVERKGGRYQVGPQLFRFGQAWKPDPVLRAAAKAPLRELAVTSNRASVSVARQDAGQLLIVGGMRGEVDNVMTFRAGAVVPPGSAANMILALTESDAPECYSKAEWDRLVVTARERGLAFDHQTVHPSVSCVAAPVHDGSGEIVATVSAVVLDSRRIAKIAEAVRRTADVVSANLASGPAWGAAQPPVQSDIVAG